MSKEDQNHFKDKKITIFLSTPLSPLGSKDGRLSDVFIIQAKVIDQVGSGLLLEVLALFDHNRKPATLKVKKIFLPLGKVDYISLT